MSRSLNRFVSAGAMSMLAACQSTPHASKPESAPKETASDSRASSAPRAAASAAAPVAGGAGASDTPVPERAAHQYADALQLMRAGRTADAETAFKQLAAANPRFAGPEVNLGLIYLQSGRLADAEAAFQAAMDRNPNNGIAGNELGIVERKLGKFSAAEAAYQHTIAATPEYAPAYLNLGVLYDLYLYEPQKALAQFEHYLELVGDNKQVSGWVVELRKRVGAGAPVNKKDPA